MLHNWTDGQIVAYGCTFMVGWLFGVAFLVALFWRRLTRPMRGTSMQLRLALEDADQQITALHAQNTKLARLLVEAKAQEQVA